VFDGVQSGMDGGLGGEKGDAAGASVLEAETIDESPSGLDLSPVVDLVSFLRALFLLVSICQPCQPCRRPSLNPSSTLLSPTSMSTPILARMTRCAASMPYLCPLLGDKIPSCHLLDESARVARPCIDLEV
jgi:hypothetical protein